MEVDTSVLIVSGGDLLETSVSLGKGWLLHAHTIQGLSAPAAGDSSGGAGLVSAAGTCAEGASGAFEALIALLETSSEVLYTCAFGYSDTDERVAEALVVR